MQFLQSGFFHSIRIYWLVSLKLLFTCIVTNALAQEVSTSLEPSKILIGDHSILSFSIEKPTESTLYFPAFEENLDDKIEIINYGITDTVISEDRKVTTLFRKLTITSWEEGLYPIVPFDFVYIRDGDTLVVESEPVLLEVKEPVLDEQAELKDIKSILSIPVTLAEVLPWILLALAVIAAAFLIYRYLKKRKKQPPTETIWEKPEIPAHVAAISSLEKLKSQKLWQQGKVKLYYIELTDILRHYIEKRFRIRALEMTTDEIMIAVKPILENAEVYENLNNILVLADLVKFARHTPLEAENENCMDNSMEFVRDTMIREVINEVNQPKK